MEVDASEEIPDACPAGQADGCKFTVEPGRTYRVVLKLTDDDALLTITDGISPSVSTITPRHALDPAETFNGVRVSGTARVRDLWVYGNGVDDTRAALHRAVGRSATMRTASTFAHTTLTSCSSARKWSALFRRRRVTPVATRLLAPWRAYCDYADTFLGDFTSPCSVQAERADVVRCQSVLSRFGTYALTPPPNLTGTKPSADRCRTCACPRP